MTHDPLCLWNPPVTLIACQCDLIARVRADEVRRMENRGLMCATDLREQIAADIEAAHNVGETLNVPVEYHLALDVAADIARGTS